MVEAPKLKLRAIMSLAGSTNARTSPTRFDASSSTSGPATRRNLIHLPR
jgi:hypothetical protein